ncbi:hypothetical protein Fmac_001804 [Flemingia macrophylla]|uniref:B-like cyclin n=1 Tax=Flemingia macrophylla TaxID=520843 RepID=A0ABD1NI53_9FABA
MTNRSRKSKRKLEVEPPPRAVTKKLRQRLPRRRRENISPVLLIRQISGENHRLSVDSSSGSDFAAGETSCNSSRTSAAGKGNANSRTESSIDSSLNRRFEKRSENEVEVSESSCVDSNSFARERYRSLILKFKRENKNPKEDDDVPEAPKVSEINVLKFKSGRETSNLKENYDVSCTKSEITSEEQFNSKSGNGNNKMCFESNGNDVVSISSGVLASFEEEDNRNKENTASECEYSEENCADLIAQSMTKQESDNYDVVLDLACSEDLRFSYIDDELDYCSSQETEFSEFHTEIFGECSQQELSDYSLSLFVDSGSQFSQGSVGETQSPTYSLLLQYRKEFFTLASPVMHASGVVEDEVSAGVKFVRFEDSDDEDSYQMLRKRERRQSFLSNYGEVYFSATEFGETVLQQRMQMVHWIVEQSYRKQLRQETMFLGVNLFDRFLSKGYFKAKRNLQIVGIACLTLAIRIEENQQYNRFYLKAANADAVVEKRVEYLAVLALSGLEQICYWPSTVAAAIVILACLEVNQNALKVMRDPRLSDKPLHYNNQDLSLYNKLSGADVSQ